MGPKEGGIGPLKGAKYGFKRVVWVENRDEGGVINGVWLNPQDTTRLEKVLPPPVLYYLWAYAASADLLRPLGSLWEALGALKRAPGYLPRCTGGIFK